MESGERSFIVLINTHTKIRHKKTQPVKWSTQGGDFIITYKHNLGFLLTELDVTKIVPWNFHVDDW